MKLWEIKNNYGDVYKDTHGKMWKVKDSSSVANILGGDLTLLSEYDVSTLLDIEFTEMEEVIIPVDFFTALSDCIHEFTDYVGTDDGNHSISWRSGTVMLLQKNETIGKYKSFNDMQTFKKLKKTWKEK